MSRIIRPKAISAAITEITGPVVAMKDAGLGFVLKISLTHYLGVDSDHKVAFLTEVVAELPKELVEALTHAPSKDLGLNLSIDLDGDTKVQRAGIGTVTAMIWTPGIPVPDFATEEGVKITPMPTT